MTVFDVAAEAGVSLATVDRVLNGRKGVRPATIGRVRSAVERLGFKRDSFAAGLATRRQERFCFMLPARGPNSFMNALRESVAAAAARMEENRVIVRILDYPAFDEQMLCRRLAELDPRDCDGVAAVAIESPPVRQEIDRLVARGIPLVTLVSDVSPSRRAHFHGIDNKAAGRVAASLIGRMVHVPRGKIAMVVGRMTLHDHADRRLGFEQVMRREFPQLALLPPIEGLDDSTVTEKLVGRLLALNEDIVGLYSIGAGNRGIIAALAHRRPSQAALPPPVTVAHELTPHARDALLSGLFTAVLHQDQEQEVADAIAALRALNRDEADFPARTVRLQIFLRDNVP
ncbi:LacI family DNA-binding transcriptional regulator [Rhizosaccharibacter radicis]|uniref:LacI family DNA-binding transcriptional regulator n=1 Tax=Rhizosaccharibacter radicis TaxID=2782605 RepID=A0ABT1VWW2_9PROT|nr:LacI family DNA-binding transcriptional regulator [Acetobacteraceae bacterium KSS12]